MIHGGFPAAECLAQQPQKRRAAEPWADLLTVESGPARDSGTRGGGRPSFVVREQPLEPHRGPQQGGSGAPTPPEGAVRDAQSLMSRGCLTPQPSEAPP